MTRCRPRALALLLFVLAGCGGGGGGGGSTQPAGDAPPVEFSLAGSPHRLVSDATFDLVGEDSGGDAWTGVWRIRSLPETTLDGQTVTPIQDTVTLTHEPSQGFTTDTDTVYINSDGHAVRMEDDEGVVCLLQEPGDFPRTARIGDFGTLDSHSCSDGTSSIATWALDAAEDDRADLVITRVVRAASGERLQTTEMILEIGEDGAIHQLELRSSLNPLDLVVNFVGTPR